MTNLNYDIEKFGNLTVDEQKRNELSKFILDELHDPYFESMMKDFNSFYEENRFYNWYHGYTKIECPYKTKTTYDFFGANVILMQSLTTAPIGTISTPYFGKEYNKSLYEYIKYEIKIFVPLTLVQNKVNFTLFWRENNTDGSNKFNIEEKNLTSNDLQTQHMGYEYYFYEHYQTWYDPYISSKDLMPGHQLHWNLDINIPYDEKYAEDYAWMLYVR